MRRHRSDSKITKNKLKTYKKELDVGVSDEDDLPLRYAFKNSMKLTSVNDLSCRQEIALNAVHNPNPLDLCCCCLELVCTKNLWLEYTWMGQVEVYGQMLKDCFNINFPLEWECREKICEVCITRLRNSYRFKHQVVLCQEKIAEKLALMGKNNKINTETTVKIEHLEPDVLFDKDSRTSQEQDKEYQDPLIYEELPPVLNNTNVEYSQCHIENNVSDKEEERNSQATVIENEIDRDAVEDFYNEESNACPEIKPVQKAKETQIKKDLKLQRISVKHVDRRTLSTHRSDYIRPRQNVSLLLEHSTIIPFKSNKGYFNCLYCNKQYIVFEELRSHVLSVHKDISFRTIIKSILRPNDRIKSDISDMTCRHCNIKSRTLEDLVEHLKTHNVKFNYDEKLLKPTDCVLPYNLSDGKYKCCVCDKEFPFFKTLTKHMNDHSTNYVCDVCGKCFLLPERLRAHVTIHVSGSSVNCEHCGKICASNAHLRSHKRHHHKKRSHVCCICNKSFATFKERMQHLQDVHNRSPPDLDCKICLKRFKTTSHLGCHVRTEHFNIPYVRKRKIKRDDGQKSIY